MPTFIKVPLGYRFLFIALVLLTAVSGISQVMAEQVGSAIVNGRIVVLDSDGTWRYQDEAGQSSQGSGCETIEGADFCLSKINWKKTDGSGDFAGLYVFANKYYFGVIFEPLGSDDGYTYEFLQDAILANAAAATGSNAKQVPVVNTSTNVEGKPEFRSITYNPTINGTPFVFHNVFKIYPKKAVQLVFWGLGTTVSSDFQGKIDEALANIDFKE